MKKKVILFLFLFIFASTAFGGTQVLDTGVLVDQIFVIQPNYSADHGNKVQFSVNQEIDLGECNSTWLMFPVNNEVGSAMLSLLMMAKTTDSEIILQVTDDHMYGTTCHVNYLGIK